MNFLKKISKTVTSVSKNIIQTAVNPVNTIKNAVLLGPIGGQAGSAIYGPNASVKQAAIATAVGASIVAAGGLAYGPAGGIAKAQVLEGGTIAAGSSIGASVIVPAATTAGGQYANSSILDGIIMGLGKGISKLSNPGAADAGPGSNPSNTPTVSSIITTKGITLIIGIGITLGVIWLILSRR